MSSVIYKDFEIGYIYGIECHRRIIEVLPQIKLNRWSDYDIEILKREMVAGSTAKEIQSVLLEYRTIPAISQKRRKIKEQHS